MLLRSLLRGIISSAGYWRAVTVVNICQGEIAHCVTKQRQAPIWSTPFTILQHALAFPFQNLCIPLTGSIKTVGKQLFLRDFVVNNNSA